MSFGQDLGVEFEGVTVKHETDLALLCVIDAKEVWIPKKCILDDSMVRAMGDTGLLVISEWIAIEKELV